MNRNLKQPDLSTVMTPTSSKRQSNGWLPTSLRGLFTVFLCWMVMLSSAMAATEEITYIHTDISGSPMAATDAAGTILWRESYRGYGERWMNQAASAKQTQWFHGKELDATGMQYFGARYYDPEIGRFTGIDPVGFRENNLGSFNRYSYVNNNPVKYFDPDGRYLDVVIEAASISIGIHSLGTNLSAGNYGMAAVDALGLAVDAALTLVPVVPGAASAGIKASREAPAAVANVTAKSAEFFRGAKSGEVPSFVPRPSDFKVDRTTGFVKDTHGLSVFDNPSSLRAKGFVPHQVDLSSIPDSLRIIQRGDNPRHFEIVPKPGANLTPEQFSNACSSIVCVR